MSNDAREHARFSPSGAERRALCPGSARMSQFAPSLPPNEYQRAGTKGHDLLEHCVQRLTPNAYAFQDTVLNEAYGPYSAEECRGPQVALDYFFLLIDLDPDAQHWCETRVRPNVSACDPEDAAGYLDVCVYSPLLRTLYLIDYKNGVKVVEHVGNRQLRQYALGAANELPVKPVVDYDKIVMTIVQPNAFHPQGSVREWSISIAELMLELDALNAELAACQQPDAPLVPSAKACEWCPAQITCPAYEAKALTVFEGVNLRNLNATTLPAPNTQEIAKVAWVLQAAPFIEQWLNSYREYAYNCARNGQYVPGFKLVEAMERRKWNGDPAKIADQLIALSDFQLSVDDVYPRTLVPLTKAETMLKNIAGERAARGKKTAAKAAAAHTMAFLTLKQSSGNLVLAPETDARPAVNAQTYFGSVDLPPVTAIEHSK